MNARDEKKLVALAQTLNNHSNSITIAQDLSESGAAEIIIKRAVSHFKEIDVLINNAACFNFGKLIDSSAQTLSDTINTNLTSAILLTRAALQHLMASKSGIIINIASTAGQHYLPEAPVYCASKHGLFGFAGSLAEQVKEHSVKVCTIAPVQLSLSTPHEKSTIPPQELAQLINYLIDYPCPNSFPSEITLSAT